jgi:hypothetical protein
MTYSDYIPTFEEFQKEIKTIWNSGNLINAYEEIRQLILFNKSFEEKGYSYQMIINKWKSSLEQWNLTYGETDPKYLKTIERDAKMTIEKFVDTKAYESEYGKQSIQHPRNKYLFPPGYEINELLGLVQKIDQTIKERRENIINGKIKYQKKQN